MVKDNLVERVKKTGGSAYSENMSSNLLEEIASTRHLGIEELVDSDEDLSKKSIHTLNLSFEIASVKDFSGKEATDEQKEELERISLAWDRDVVYPLAQSIKEFITNNPEYSVPVIEVNAFAQDFKSFIEAKAMEQKLEDIIEFL